MQEHGEEWLFDRVANYWRNDFNRFVAEAFPWGEPPFDVVVGCKGWRKRFPNCKHGLDKWAYELGEALSEEVRKRNFDGKHAVKPIRIAVSSGHGIGKQVSVNAYVDTPDGVKRWGDIKVGDHLWGPSGVPVKVIAIPYRGVRPSYRVTFDDGSSTIVGQEHLWTVRGRQERRKGLSTWRTLETQEILKLGVKRPNGAAMARQWEIPKHEPVQYPEADQPVPAYFMGCWLGDGSRGHAEICTDEPESIRHLNDLYGPGIELRPNRGTSLAARRVLFPNWRRAFRSMPISGAGSCERYIPDEYKYASVEQRFELLRGLVDSDADVGKQGSITYSTTSERLAHDVVWLARSLGAKAKLQPAVKKAFYRDEQGNPVYCKDCYRATLTFPSGACVGYATHKTERLPKNIQERYLTRWIESIEPVGDLEGMCVTVDCPDGLFLANDFIVTHNSFLTGLIVWWIMSTRPDCKGTITATTMPQLEAKTWAQIAALQRYCLTGHWFEITQGKGSMRFYAKDARESWQCTAQTSKEENSESFAGQHAASSTSFYVVDESSGIPNKIWEVAEGGLTDGEPMIFAFGNPTKASGGFYDCFHKDAARWIRMKVDSREAQLTNKEQIKEWAETYGEDSDFFKVRVRGEFPDNASVQFIPTSAVESAMSREAPGLGGNSFKRAVVGLDIARFGDDASVIATRVGRDAVSIPMKEIRKMDGPHVGQALAAHCNYLLDTLRFKEVRIYFDRAGVGASVWDWLRYEYNDPRVRYYPVDFGSKAQKANIYANKRIEMWGRLKEWLITGGGVIPRSEQLKTELISPEYSYNDRQQMILERKKDLKDRIGCSPDHVDALALTFAEENADVINDDTSGSIRRYRRMQDLDPTLALDREDAGW